MVRDQKSKVVVVVGASPKPDRYAYKAMAALLENGYKVIPQRPAGGVILAEEAVSSLEEVTGEVDTVTLYVRAAISGSMQEALLALHPRRVLFNPGAENKSLMQVLDQAGIETQEACTLVMLATGQF